LAIGPIKTDGALRQSIDVRRLHFCVTLARQMSIEIIGDDEQHVRELVGGDRKRIVDGHQTKSS
jgi:hypothetical protein